MYNTLKSNKDINIFSWFYVTELKMMYQLILKKITFFIILLSFTNIVFAKGNKMRNY